MVQRTEKDILRDILIYYRNGIGDLNALQTELGREVTEAQVTIELNNANIRKSY
jgi:hypothetical protein